MYTSNSWNILIKNKLHAKLEKYKKNCHKIQSPDLLKSYHANGSHCACLFLWYNLEQLEYNPNDAP